MSECRYTGSFCGDTSCPVHGQPWEPQLLPDVQIPSGWEVIESPGVGIAFRRAGSGYRYVTLEIIRELVATVGLQVVPRSGDQIAPDAAEPAEKQPDSR